MNKFFYNFFYKSGLDRLRKFLSPDLRKKNSTKKNFSVKNPGVVILLPTIILSGLILVISIGLSRVLIAELEFSADLLFSEKAYFAAESGVEKSLLVLKKNSLNWVEGQEPFPVGTGTEYEMAIANAVKIFDVSLGAFESIKFRLAVDTDSSGSEPVIEPVVNIRLTQDNGSTPLNNPDLQWKFLCPVSNLVTGTVQTVSIQGRADDFFRGRYDDGTQSIDNYDVALFWNNKDENCFMSLTNQSSDQDAPNIVGSIAVNSDRTIAPAKVAIRVVGTSFSREKIVTFEYFQKNLASVFDFGLYFIGE